VRRPGGAIVERGVVIRRLIEDGEVGLIGAHYDLESGEVRFFDQTLMCGEIKHFYLDVPDRMSLMPFAR